MSVSGSSSRNRRQSSCSAASNTSGGSRKLKIRLARERQFGAVRKKRDQEPGDDQPDDVRQAEPPRSIAIRQATSSRTPIGASETPSMRARISGEFAEVCPAAACPLCRSGVRVLFRDGQAEIAIRLPGLRVGPAPLAGAVRRLRRVEHAGRGERRGVEHLRRQAQSAGRRAGDPAGRARDADVALPERLPSGLAELDRAIGGGIVAGSAMLVGGDPGIGKSTLLLQVAARLAQRGQQGRLCLGRGSRPSRCGCARGGWGSGDAPVRLAAATSVRDILTTLGEGEPPALLVIDSIQTMHSAT